MEYSDGPDQVEPGDGLVMDHENLGVASYDSDHDGVADSVILGLDDHTVMFTDSDGDGEVDSRTTYGPDGEVLDQRDISGQDETAGSSQTTDSSGSDTSGSDTSGSDTSGSDSSGSDTSGSDTSGSDTSGSDTSGSDTSGDNSGESSSTVITVLDDQGRSVDVGPPTVDMDGDGTPDTAVVQGDGGSTIGYTDRNGDGEADQITEITADRHVTISVMNSAGEWEVAQTGTLDANGHFIPSEDASRSSNDLRNDGPASESVAWGILPTDTVGSSDVAAGQPAADSAPTADAEAAGSIPIVYTDPDGNTYELGLPTEDFNGDGRPDTVITTLADGTIVGYSDVDGDGLTDQVTQINTDGSVTIGVPDGVGGWEEAATGTLGANGEFVPA